MLKALAALTPSLVVCAAFLIGVVMFLRRQMGAKRAGDGEGPADIPDAARNDVPGEQPPASSARRSEQ